MFQTPVAGSEEAGHLVNELRLLKTERGYPTERLERLSIRILSAILDSPRLDQTYQDAIIGTLCELATDGHPHLNEMGRQLIFSGLVERLSDSFRDEHVALYDRFFARVIEHCRHLPDFRAFDSMLGRFGIRDERDLLARRTRMRSPATLSPLALKAIKTVFVLSRVSLGAEVAITSLILEKIQRSSPQAKIVLLAPGQVIELFTGDTRVRVVEVPFERRGGLVSRLGAWISLVDTLHRERRALEAGEYLVIDPDSRLTQLGLLPVTEQESAYCFFESRSFKKAGMDSIGQLTVSWLHGVFGGGEDEPLYPHVSLRPSDLSFGEALCQRFLARETSHIVAVNFGVGQSPRKRISDAFELELLRKLLDSGSVIVLDKGIADERHRADRMIAALREEGRKVVEVKQGAPPKEHEGGGTRCDVLAWEGGVGTFSALIAFSDLYIGYDSAFQHIAAALGIPVIDIFVDVPSPLFFARWQPYTWGIARPVKVDTRQLPHGDEAATGVLAQVLASYEEVRRLRPRPRHTLDVGISKVPGGPKTHIRPLPEDVSEEE